MIWATVSFQSCFCWLYRVLHLWLEEYNQNVFSIDYLVMSICRVFSCVVGRGFCYEQCVLFAKLLGCAQLHLVFQGQTCLLLQVSLDFLLLHSSPLWWKGLLFWVLVLEGLVDLHRTIQFQHFQYSWLGHRLGLLWYWMICLGNKLTTFCHFTGCKQVPHFQVLCWPWGLLHFL